MRPEHDSRPRTSPWPSGRQVPPWAGVSDEQWDDWRWQARHALTEPVLLGQVLDLTDEELRGLAATRSTFRMAIPPYYAALMDPLDPRCPVRRMAVPRVSEAIVRTGERRDPLGEDDHTPVPGLVHRYPDRALLLVNNVCVMYCRFCTRKRLTGRPNETLSSAQLGRALDYLRAHPEVRDVLVSGGDPLLLSDRRLSEVLAGLAAIDSVEMVRLGTRIPVVMPQRVTAGLVRAISAHHPVFVVTHFNHAKELTPAARGACTRLVDAGIPVENQAVLLRGVNSSVRIIRELMHELLRCRVRPYYLHQCDVAEGLEPFRTPIAKGIEIIEGLRGHTSGLAVPTLVVDCPGGGGKVPLSPQYLVSWAEDHVVLRNYEGRLYNYPEPEDRDCTCPYEAAWFGDRGRAGTRVSRQ